MFGKYLDHILVKFEQNRAVGTINNFVLFNKKWLTIFLSVSPILEDISLTKNNCLVLKYEFKDYTPTRLTRLKVAPNTADPISLNENLPLP